MKLFVQRSNKLKDLILLAIIGMLPLLWFRQDYINGGDFAFPMAKMGNAWISYANIWTDKWGLGLVNARAIPQLPFMFIFTLGNNLGISTAILERLLFYILFTMSGISIYLLVVDIMPFKIERRAIAFFAALFYMFNPFNIIFYWHVLDGMIFVYAFLPALLVCYLQWFKTKRFFYAFLFIIITFLSAYTFSNPLIIPILWLLLLVFTFIVKGSNYSLLSCVKFYILAGIIWSFLNGWWLVPLFGSLHEEYSGLSSSIGTPWYTLKSFSMQTSLLNLLRISDLYWAFSKNIFGDPFYTYAQTYFTKSFMLISIIFPLVMFAPLLLRLKSNRGVPKFVLFIYALTLGYLFFAKGNHSPFGVELYTALFRLPFFPSFRAPIHKLGVLISINYALLFGYGLTEIFTFLKEKLPTFSFPVMATIGIMTLVIYPYPIWTGEVIQRGGRDYPSYHVSVPDYYYEAASWMDSDKNYFRYYSLPQSPTLNVAYNWENGYIGSDPKYFIFSKPGVYSTVDSMTQLPYKILHDRKNKDAYKLFVLQNVKYILLHNDINEKHWDIFTGRKVSLEHLKNRLNEQNNIRFVESFGKLDFYKISDKYFLPHIYPASGITLVSSDINSLIPLTYTPYIGGYPALVFTEQQNEDGFQSIVGSPSTSSRHSHKSTGGNTILFANRNFNDLVIDMARAESEAKGLRQEAGGERLENGGWRLEVGGRRLEAKKERFEVGGLRQENDRLKSQKPILVKLDNEGKGNFRVKDNGVYEVWIKNGVGGLRLEGRGLELEVDIDGDELEGGEGREDNKWIRVGEVELDKGKHRITVASQQSAVRNLDKKKFEKIVQNLEIVIVAKEKLEEYRNIISQRPIGYLFYIDKEKVENMLKDKEELERIKLKGDNPFTIGKQQFYIPEDGNYLIKAMMKPKRDFLLKDFVGSNINIIKASLEAISGWDISALNTIYKQNISEDGMHIDAYFQGRRDVKESIILTKKFSGIAGIDIKERPYLAFACSMEDADVQEVEIDVVIRLPDSGKTKRITLTAGENKQYGINLYEMATKKWRNAKNGKTVDNLFVDEVVLRLKKKDGVDVSGKRRKIYSFVFKNIAFLKTPPILAAFEDKLTAYLPDYCYYFNRNGELKKVNFPEQVPWDIKDVYRLHLNRFVDLKETPVLSLSFPKPIIDKNIEAERRDFSQEWKVVLGLDFNGDEKEDGSVEMFVPAISLSSDKLLLNIQAYEEAKRRFPNERNYNLVSLGISHPDDKEIFYQNVMSKKLIRYREHIYQPLEVRGERQEVRGGRLEVRGERIEAKGERQEAKGAGVLEVDGKIYKLPPKVKGVRQEVRGGRLEVRGEREDNNWVEFNNIQLEEGEHSLKVLENGKFKVEMVEIKSEVRGERLEVGGGGTEGRGGKGLNAKDQSPVIEFKKINPTRYVVNVKGAKNPFTLVFSESFHERWKGYIRHRSEVRGGRLEGNEKEEPWSALWSAWKDGGKRIEIKNHFVVNGYANGWIVPIEQMLEVRGKRLEAGENFEIVLEFKPQRLFEIGLIISMTTLFGCIGYLGYGWGRRKKEVRGRRFEAKDGKRY